MKKSKRALFRKIFLFGSIAAIIIVAFIITANKIIIKESASFITNNIEQLPNIKCALLLGTSKKLKNGIINPYFSYRINAAVDLYKSGKIKYIIVSGDNSRKDYNEPQDMKDALVSSGIPANVIYLDYAGFRTFDSVIRCREIFDQDSVIIVSQKFHNERAVYLARKSKIIAYGFNAQDVSKGMGLKTNLREYLAKSKVFLDILFNTKPRFLGEKVTIGE